MVAENCPKYSLFCEKLIPSGLVDCCPDDYHVPYTMCPIYRRFIQYDRNIQLELYDAWFKNMGEYIKNLVMNREKLLPQDTGQDNNGR